MIIEKYYKPGLIVRIGRHIFVSKNNSFVKPETRLNLNILTGKFERIVNWSLVISYYDRISK